MTVADVPGRLPVAIGTHGYMSEAGMVRQTVPVIRQQADTSPEAGEQTLNPQGLWRRSQESWHHGAGQAFLDGRQGDEPPDPHRFRSSKGVNPWTKGQLSLLRPTLKVWSTTSTNLFLAVAQESGGIFLLYVADDEELYQNPLPFNGLNSLALQQGTGWTPTNATIAAVDEWFTLTATSAAIPTAVSPAGLSGVPVDAGRNYAFVFQSVYVSGGAAKTANVAVRWYDAAGATITTTTPVVASGTDGGGGAIVFGQATAPAGAAFAALVLSYTGAWANGEIHRVRTVAIGPYENVSALQSPDIWFAANIQAGEAAEPIQSIATNGSYVWAALGTSGIHRNFASATTSVANVPDAPVGGQISLVGYANGFLLAAGSDVSTTNRNVLWLVNSPLEPAPTLTAIKTHPNSLFAWTGISTGRSCVYAFGNSGGNGEIYKIIFDPNTGTLSTAASPASFLPDGETIHALYFYAGAVILGTGKGLRIGQAGGDGNIDYGPLIPTDWPVRCLEPQDRYCWFGWTKYDSDTSGLGRIDLGFLTDTLTPAWASDLMTADLSTGDVVSAVTYAPYGYTSGQRPPVRVFTVAGEGVYIEDPGSRVLQGNLETGAIRFSTSEPKITRSLDIRHHAMPLGGVVAVEMQRDSEGSYGSILGSSSTTDSYGPATPIDLDNEQVEAMEFRFTMTQPDNDGTDFTRSPELTRWTAKVLPTPSTIDETFEIKLIMRSEVKTGQGDGGVHYVDVPAEIAYLKGLERSREIVDMQDGQEIFSAYVAGSRFESDQWGPGRLWREGIYTVQAQTVRG